MGSRPAPAWPQACWRHWRPSQRAPRLRRQRGRAGETKAPRLQRWWLVAENAAVPGDDACRRPSLPPMRSPNVAKVTSAAPQRTGGFPRTPWRPGAPRRCQCQRLAPVHGTQAAARAVLMPLQWDTDERKRPFRLLQPADRSQVCRGRVVLASGCRLQSAATGWLGKLPCLNHTGGSASIGWKAVMVKSAVRVFELLEMFGAERRPLRVADIVERLGAPQSSVSMLLKSLVARGYMEFDAAKREYCPSIRISFLGDWTTRMPDRPEAIQDA